LTPESQPTAVDDLGLTANNAHDLDATAAQLEQLGYALWRPTSPSRKVDLLARHPDGTIIRIHRAKRPIMEFDCSHCHREVGAPVPKPVVIELTGSKNWLLVICYWANWCWAEFRSALYIAPYWVRGNVTRPIKRIILHCKMPERVVKLKPIYTEPSTTESQWRGWGL
jgi:hypothetical protein